MFSELLKRDKIDADEINVFDHLDQWAEHDAPNRLPFVAPLAKLIRLEHLPTEV